MLRNRSRALPRGFSLAEVLTVLVILSFVLGLVAGILGPLVHQSTQAQAKAETVQTAAQIFYTIQRDLRQTSAQGVFLCTYSATPTCGQSANPVIAIATADNSVGQYQVTGSGNSSWQGFVVYWVSGGTLYRSYQPVAIAANPPTAADAAVAVAAANPPSSPAASVAARGVQSLTVTANAGASNAVSLTMVAANSEGGASNSTSYQSNTVARNSY